MPEHTCYVEPFAGAGHVLFSKPESKVEILNDIDQHLISFFKVIQETDKRQTLTNILSLMPYSRKLWQELRVNWKHGNIPGDPIEQAAQWFYLNRSAFAGDMLKRMFTPGKIRKYRE